jgi:DNA-directed RNA polymerase specialized sigma24 family protein
MNRKKDIEQLFRQHYAKMYNLARCILSDDDESKDVVSEVFAQTEAGGDGSYYGDERIVYSYLSYGIAAQ